MTEKEEEKDPGFLDWIPDYQRRGASPITNVGDKRRE